jgi:hypothetical protein
LGCQLWRPEPKAFGHPAKRRRVNQILPECGMSQPRQRRQSFSPRREPGVKKSRQLRKCRRHDRSRDQCMHTELLTCRAYGALIFPGLSIHRLTGLLLNGGPQLSHRENRFRKL